MNHRFRPKCGGNNESSACLEHRIDIGSISKEYPFIKDMRDANSAASHFLSANKQLAYCAIISESPMGRSMLI